MARASDTQEFRIPAQQSDSSSVPSRQFPVLSVWAITGIAWLIVGLSSRHELDADGIAYADIAKSCAQGHWHALVNGYWSPAYPALLGVWFRIFHPGPAFEITSIRLFSCLALAGALASFHFFLRALSRYRRFRFAGDGEPLISNRAFEATGYGVFLWTTIFLTPPSVNAPDILVLSSVLLASALVMEICCEGGSFARFAGLGALLGLAYLCKAAMFPLAFVFLIVALTVAPNLRKALPLAIAGLLCFAMVSGPFVIALSKAKDRVTFGDSGAIAYAMSVDYVDITVYWRGDPPGSGVPKHPVRKISDSPPVYEYAAPIGGSYPLWYDHSYWYDGVRPHLRLRKQLNVIHIGMRDYFNLLFVQLGALTGGFLALAWCASWLGVLRRFLCAFPVWLPAVTGFAMYALVHVEPRFLSGFVILLWAGCFVALRCREHQISSVVVRGVLVGVLIVLGLQIGVEVGHMASGGLLPRAYPDLEVAQKLNQIGIGSGDRVSYIGDALTDHLWAHLAGVSLASEVPLRGVPDFWAATVDSRRHIYELFAGSGAKAVVTTSLPPEIQPDGWQQVGATKYYILPLPSAIR
jgi:hypothetical protein